MSISDAFITVDCDECGDTVEMTMELRYSDYSGKHPFYDMGETLARATREGWRIDADSDTAVCPDCATKETA